MPGGRPLKNGVDYFPLDVIMDDKFELIEAEHGIEGFGVLIKLYQKIYANNYWIKFDKKAILVFSNRINVDKNSINVIINSCIEWEIFDKKLFKKYEILTSGGIQKRFFEIVKRRKVVEVCKEYLLIKIDVNVYKNLINVDCNSQRKGKEEERKEKKKKSKPKKDTLLDYLILKIQENNFIETKDKIFEFYQYRQAMVKNDRYKSDKGIDFLFKDLIGCRDNGLIVSECIDEAIGRNWKTPKPTYFKNNKPVNGYNRMDQNKQACKDFINDQPTKAEIEKENKEYGI